MPSPHRRVGLVLDEPVLSVFDLFREVSPEGMPDAAVARKAVLEGGLLEATVKAASGHDAGQDLAREVLDHLRRLVPSLALNAQAKAEIMELLARAQIDPSADERRRRQLALIRAADRPSGGQSAQDMADTFDAFEYLPSP